MTAVAVVPTPATWSYILIRLLFKFVLKIFFGSIVVENSHLIPQDGHPIIVTANHSNSLTDAVMLVACVPRNRRTMLRLTAKATQFGRGTFTSWLIESAGTLPLMRLKDYTDKATVNNSAVMDVLKEALERGDAVCMFPEGFSRFHPTVAPMKTGVARLVSEVLSRQRDNPDFKISIQPVSMTYMHRQHFRSDVLVSFHAPITFSPQDNPELLEPVDFDNIRAVTSTLSDIIRSGTLDSPSWDYVRTAKLTARLYAPLGTHMSLGEYVRVTQRFLEAFKANTALDGHLEDLMKELKEYQDELVRYGIKDDRVRRQLPRRIILRRMCLRLPWAVFLFSLSSAGMLLWLPVFATTIIAVHKLVRTGPVFDTYDEIAQYKLVYGFLCYCVVWAGTIVVTFPIAPFTFFVTPALMWVSLRWFEDAVSAFRAFMALARLLRVGKGTLNELRAKRERLYARVMELAKELELPDDPETYFATSGGREKGRIMGRWDSNARYFSLNRRRKKDWNETLRLYESVDYPAEDY
ncbi:hypothetical protein BKA62DRAFT_685252 [Auriculariales sp. MPI-PUGE-AT-0066]|nr:hypothetical protein BKA62DRAFT_685252 [Auriculariales sp. MPI-PUGE-AT-0066]